MQRHGHDQVCLREEPLARLPHPARERDQPVAPAGAFEVQHETPRGGVIDKSSSCPVPARRAGDTDSTDRAVPGVCPERSAATVAHSAGQKVDLAKFVRGERPLADATFPADQRAGRPEEISCTAQKGL